MSDNDHRSDAVPGPLPDALRWQLHALRQPKAPARDLWPEIASRLPAAGAGDRQQASTRRRWRLPVSLAAAASLLLAVGLADVWNTAAPPAADGGPTATLVQREAAGLTMHYQAAVAELSTLPPTPVLQPAIEDLDRSAALILEALDQDPDSRMLLEQLRRTYVRRIALAQRGYS